MDREKRKRGTLENSHFMREMSRRTLSKSPVCSGTGLTNHTLAHIMFPKVATRKVANANCLRVTFIIAPHITETKTAHMRNPPEIHVWPGRLRASCTDVL